MSENFEAKKVVVEEIKEKINASKSVVLVHYERVTVAESAQKVPGRQVRIQGL